MNPERSPGHYLRHIADAIERIDCYTRELTEADFCSSEFAQEAVICNIEIIGEACNNLDERFPEFSKAHPDLPLTIAYQMRNALRSKYPSMVPGPPAKPGVIPTWMAR